MFIKNKILLRGNYLFTLRTFDFGCQHKNISINVRFFHVNVKNRQIVRLNCVN